MIIMKKLLILFLLLFASTPVWSAMQDHQVLRDMVASFVKQQTAAMHDKVNYQVDEIDGRINLSACNKIQVFLPSGSQLIGRTSVGVRCNDTQAWTVFVPVQIKISMDLLISKRQLTSGHVLQADDLYPQTIEVTQLSGLSDMQKVIGKVLRFSIAAGQVMREDMLRAPYSVTQGQTVQLLVQASGFSVSGSGQALANAIAGQYVRVKNDAGGVVSGMARDNGIVELMP